MLWLLSTHANAQRIIENNYRLKTIAVKDGRTLLDTLSIVPRSLRIPSVDSNDYFFDPATAVLLWKKKPATDSVRIRYRVMPLLLSRHYAHKERRLIDSLIAFSYDPTSNGGNSDKFVDFNALQYNGSYGRSISVGNTQDAALQSHFNLQAGGYLPDSIHLEAALSDNTLPFQPEGNTQRLQEFDQVYIRLMKGRNLLQLGDYNIEKPKGYFLNFNKRVQGIYFSSGFRPGTGADNSFGLSASVAKGEFARNIFDGLEGNQGPYKLTGNNGEQYFIVLAGTERVYINGLIQERGENAGYIINYNTGEIRFMPRRLITKDSRIQVEFEYQSRTFLNSLVYAWDDLQVGKKWNMHLNVYSNQDAKNQGYTQTLDGEQKRFLSTIGDSIQNAYYPVITTDTFSASKILYKLVDTVVAGVLYDSVALYSINPDSARYNVQFSYVGSGKGDYIISSRAANGRVYDWLPRMAGKQQGDYAPVQLLITPKLQQVFTLGTTYRIDSLKSLSMEVSGSNYNPNLFSTTTADDHLGAAAKIHYNERRFLGTKDSLGRERWTWTNDGDYEFVQDKFRAIAPYRSVEFGRDWNVPQEESAKPNENLLGYNTSIAGRGLGTATYAFNYYSRNSTYNGIRDILGYTIDRGRWHTNLVLNLLSTTDTGQRTRFFRPTALGEYRVPRLNNAAIGATMQHEGDQLRDANIDTLRGSSFKNTILSAFIRTPEQQPLRYSVTYTNRTDEQVRGNAFLMQSHSHTVDARFGIARTKAYFIQITASYRRLIVDDTLFNNQRNEETGLGRIEYNGNLLRGALLLQTLYETGAGQEQKRTYTYVEVPAGQGVYTWVDYNGDGVQEANEFEIAVYPDQKKFIRVFTPTNEYVRVNYCTFNQSITIDPAIYYGAAKLKGWKALLARISDVGSLQITNRLTNTSTAEAINPFIPALRDDRIILANTSLSNTAYFNRSGAAWGTDYTYQHNTGKQLLTYGVEGQTNVLHTARLRWNITPAFSTNIYVRNGLRAYESALSDGRTYAVHSNSGEPSLSWLHRGVLRITATLRYEDRKNKIAYGGEHATIQRTDLEMRYSKAGSGVILLRAGYAGITYDGLTAAPVAFTILDALQPGANFLWYANWDKRLSKGIELALEYEGRKPGTGAAVHTGRMTVRAIL